MEEHEFSEEVVLLEEDEQKIARLIGDGCRSGHLDRTDGSDNIHIYFELKISSWKE